MNVDLTLTPYSLIKINKIQSHRLHRAVIIRSKFTIKGWGAGCVCVWGGRPQLTRRVLSQEAEQSAVPSGDTRTRLTRFSWPNRTETRVPFKVSHALMGALSRNSFTHQAPRPPESLLHFLTLNDSNDSTGTGRGEGVSTGVVPEHRATGRGGGGWTDTKVLPVSDGARSRDKTSAVWPWKLCSSCPLSTSHNAQVPSPLENPLLLTCMSELVKLQPDT
ncbi:hypothetical protein EYF80_059627 [Liparis tanakae]|uniref:Uncharacterized protein n=1 Tax=Liparis tanakae TaxID=230148 RepID=A0A4Z2EPG9_9TELE|nr:hypothetical protein EYF80_059627 [Liparis tanakae]